jgi:DNA polymerase III sliding clamp (beta) subunit (PCNA family)
MKITVDAKVLSNIVKVFGFIGDKPLNAIVGPKSITFEGTDGEIRMRRVIESTSLVTEGDTDERVAINHKLLLKTVSTLKGELTLTATDKKNLLMECKDSTYKLPQQEYEQDIQFAKPKGAFSVPGPLLKRGLVKALPFTAEPSQMRPAMEGIRIVASDGKLWCWATSGFMLCKFEMLANGIEKPIDILLPRKTAQLLQLIPAEEFNVYMSQKNNFVGFGFDDGVIESALITEPYPAVDDVTSSAVEKCTNTVIVSKKAMEAALAPVALYTSPTTHAIDFLATAKKFELRAVDEDFGAFAKQWQDEPHDGIETNVLTRFKSSFFTDILGVVDSDKLVVKFNGQGGPNPIIVTPSTQMDENLLLLLMPMRIDDYEEEYTKAFATGGKKTKTTVEMEKVAEPVEAEALNV